MKNRLAIIFTALLTLCLTSCGKINEIGITSTSIVSLSPVGLRGMNGVFAVGIHNPTFSFTIRNVQGVVYHKGQAMIDFSADDFTVNKKSDDVYQIKGSVSGSFTDFRTWTAEGPQRRVVQRGHQWYGICKGAAQDHQEKGTSAFFAYGLTI